VAEEIDGMSDPVRDAIIGKLQAIAEIGQVFPYEPYFVQPPDLVKCYTYNGRIRGWSVRRVALVETKSAIGISAKTYERVDWMITGYLETINGGASEATFDGLIDAIRQQVRIDFTFGISGLTSLFNERAGIEIAATGLVMFAGVVCHWAQLELTTQRLI
jgi:hypothetical protein